MKLHTFISKIFFASLLALFAVSASAGITVTYFHNDLTGSPVAATNETGQVVWRKNYTPYGETAGKDRDNRVGYTGHQEESNGLVYAGARYYDPALGRFMSVDPKGFSDKYPMSFNRYAYANNNPYKYVDPDGRFPFLIVAIPVVYAGVGAVTAGVTNAAMQYAMTGNVQMGGIGGVVDAMGDGAMLGPLGVAAGASTSVTTTAATGAKNPANGLKLNKSLASEAQMSEAGTSMAGASASRPFRDAPRAAREHGGNADDWAKMKSSSHTAPDGAQFRTHWLENTKTNQRAEFKTKLGEAE